MGAIGTSVVPIPARRPWRFASLALWRSPMFVIGLAIFVGLLACSLLGPIVLHRDPVAIHQDQALRPPGRAFPFGTDEVGRDLLARVLVGMRVSMGVSAAAVLLGGTTGIMTGIVAGYTGGALDAVIMRVWDVVSAFPGALLAVAVAAATGPGTASVVIAGALLGLPFFSRLVRANTLVEREREYVMAARSLGASDARILRRHIIPNVLVPVLVQASNLAGQATLLEAAMSFLGLGVQPPEPSLGAMLSKAQAVLGLAPWYAVSPGLALVLLVVAANFIADGGHELLTPR